MTSLFSSIGDMTTLKCFTTLACTGLGVDADTIWNEAHSANAARMVYFYFLLVLVSNTQVNVQSIFSTCIMLYFAILDLYCEVD